MRTPEVVTQNFVLKHTLYHLFSVHFILLQLNPSRPVGKQTLKTYSENKQREEKGHISSSYDIALHDIGIAVVFL